jgi:D-serine dehydratase
MAALNITEDEILTIKNAQPLLWLNNAFKKTAAPSVTPNRKELFAAEARLARFAPLLARLFSELEAYNGLIESPLLSSQNTAKDKPNLYYKADHQLPVAGSIKARGGIHEVLHFAESLAIENNIINEQNFDYKTLAEAPARALYQRYTIAVGSTGNLGLSIGIMANALGFKAVVHMSSDAKEWKKERLRKRGVSVIEHASDYGAAVAAGRAESDADPFSYFVDDENSSHLFMGYAVAALRLRAQLDDQNIVVDHEHPLFVYLPAGVGGAPGGITFGLKSLFGEDVHCFFAEPVQAPCMLLGMAGSQNSNPMHVKEMGLSIDTDADGLAVGTASQWVCDATRHLLSGVYTATDTQLYQSLLALKENEKIEVEPSAAIACIGPSLFESKTGQAYLAQHNLTSKFDQSTHIAWLTGGSFVPEEEYLNYLDKARRT